MIVFVIVKFSRMAFDSGLPCFVPLLNSANYVFNKDKKLKICHHRFPQCSNFKNPKIHKKMGMPTSE